MSNLKRLYRVFKSWTGKVSRDVYYEFDDARMILTDLGIQMSPETFAYLNSKDELLDSFLHQIYATEDHTGRFLIENHTAIDPIYEPKVYELDGKATFTIQVKGKEIIFAEFDLPHETPSSKSKTEKDDAENAKGRIIEIEIE